MTADDLDACTAALTRVAAVCGRRMTDDLASVYFDALQDLPLDALERACTAFARTVETGRRFPSPRELREWVSQRGTPNPGLTADEAQRVFGRVAGDLMDWEREGRPGGTAWPVFEMAWQNAIRAEHLARRARPTLDRQACWQRWLDHGATDGPGPLASRTAIAAIYRDVVPRIRPGSPLRDALDDIATRIEIARDRDPGEES